MSISSVADAFLRRAKKAEDDLAAAIARAEKAERERDEAKRQAFDLREAVLDRRRERDEAVAALQLLYDEQNGPPLERHAEWWRAAMDAAEAVLAKAQDRDAAKGGE